MCFPLSAFCSPGDNAEEQHRPLGRLCGFRRLRLSLRQDETVLSTPDCKRCTAVECRRTWGETVLLRRLGHGRVVVQTWVLLAQRRLARGDALGSGAGRRRLVRRSTG